MWIRQQRDELNIRMEGKDIRMAGKDIRMAGKDIRQGVALRILDECLPSIHGARR